MTRKTAATELPAAPIRITLGYFKDFPTVAGLLRATGARRVDSRVFLIENDMTITQVVALVQLLQYSRSESSDPVKVETTPSLGYRFDEAYEELDAWWGTVNEPNWL